MVTPTLKANSLDRCIEKEVRSSLEILSQTVGLNEKDQLDAGIDLVRISCQFKKALSSQLSTNELKAVNDSIHKKFVEIIPEYSILKIPALAVLDQCTSELASEPYCLTVASAEKNCQSTPNEINAVKYCITDKLEKYGTQKMLRPVINRMCLAISVQSSDESKNNSLCKP
jgi:hypothetical protein